MTTKFKVGDRVRYLTAGWPEGRVIHSDRYRFTVNWASSIRGVIGYEHGDETVELLTATSSDPVNTPTHYQHPSGIEVIEITRHESFLRGNVLKYVMRAPYKGNELEDLKKAAKYLSWEIERVENAVPDAE